MGEIMEKLEPISGELKYCLDEGKKFGKEAFWECIKEKNRKVAIVGTSCSGKSTVLKSLVPKKIYDKVYHKGTTDEDMWDLPLTTTNLSIGEIRDKVTDLIIVTRHPRDILKCMIDERGLLINIPGEKEMVPIEKISQDEKLQKKALGVIAKEQGEKVDEVVKFHRDVFFYHNK